MSGSLLLALAGTTFAAAGSIKDVEHIVLFMQENRAFDHYFGKRVVLPSYLRLTLDRHNGWCPRFQGSQCSDQQRQAGLLPKRQR
jgi:phospholipase C